MGNWKLEAFKMALYMSFPVAAFLVFNSPQFYQNAIYEWRKELDRISIKDPEFEQYVKDCQRKQMQKEIAAIEAMSGKQWPDNDHWGQAEDELTRTWWPTGDHPMATLKYSHIQKSRVIAKHFIVH